jgi:aspartate kinase
VILRAEGLPAFYVDARRCIVTNEHHGQARPLLEITRRRTRAEIIPLLESERIPVLGGFIATTRNGVPTTLGRGASDYTATLVGAAIGARETQIWTDVDGILTADPNLVPTARSIPVLSYAEAAELSRFGAKVLHAKSILPAAEQNVPLRVFNSREPEFPGTLICDSQSESLAPGIKALACKANQTVVRLTLKQPYLVRRLRRVIERMFREHHSTAEVITIKETVATFACERTGTLETIVRNLDQFGSLKVTSDRALVCCVADRRLDATDRARIFDRSVKWQRLSSVSLIADVPQARAHAIVRALHQRIFDDPLIEGWHDRTLATMYPH